MGMVTEKRAKLSGSVEVLAASASGARPFRMIAYTGAEFMRRYGRAVADMSGMTAPAKLPILVNHDENRVAGYADKQEFTAEGLVLSGVLVDTKDGAEVARLSDQGFPWTASIGVDIGHVDQLTDKQTAKCNGLDVSGPLTIWRKTSLFETSFVTSNPADKNTSAAALGSEDLMSPEEFAAAHPVAVAAWKAEGAKLERERLGALSTAIPGRAEFVIAQFTAGADVLTAKAALCDVLIADAEKPQEKTTTLADLKLKAGSPGVGFDGNARENAGGGDTTKNLAPADRAKAEFAKDPHLAQITTVEALTAFYRAEARGLVREDTITRAASALRAQELV